MFQFLDFVKRNRASILTILSLVMAVLGLCKDQVQNMPPDVPPTPAPPHAQPQLNDDEPPFGNREGYGRDYSG